MFKDPMVQFSSDKLFFFFFFEGGWQLGESAKKANEILTPDKFQERARSKTLIS